MKTNAKTFRRACAIVLTLLMVFNMTAFAASETENLVAKLYWTDDVVNGPWTDVESADAGTIFNVTDFEPGSEVIRYLKIANSGSSAFSYDLKMISDEIGELASVIDVYFKKDVTANAAVADMTKIGTLAEVINGEAFSEGNIMPAGENADNAYSGETVVAVALKMDASVSSDYMNKTAGEFSIQLNVTSFDAADKFEVKFPNTTSYMYRVGNANTVSLGSLFKTVDGVDIGNVSVTINSLDENTGASGVYTANASDWTEGTIQFSGTGPVEVVIDDDKYTNPVTLKLEIVDATNVTEYSGLKNKTSVLLNDITMSSGANYYLSNATLYGNGFTFDVTNGAYTGSGSVSNNYLVCLSNASIDNVEIVGSVYTQYGGTVGDNYNRPVVLSIGDTTITNSYIANCSAPVRVRDGNLEIINTTLKGGNFANLDIRNGNVVLDNVTTINQVNGNDVATDGTVVVGFGVVVFYENVQDTTTVEIRNGITQYNNLSKDQADTYIKDTSAKTLTTVMFTSQCSDIQYTDANGELWVNTGILSMTETVNDTNITDVSGYSSVSPTFSSTTAYVHSPVPDASCADAAPGYETAGQYAIAPTAVFEYPVEGNKNYSAVTEGSNKWCYYDNGTVRISFDDGDSVSFDPSILTVTKQGQALPYTVTMNGTDYIGKTITFNSSGDYQLIYTYADDNNYKVDENGDIQKYTMSYTKTINIKTSAVMPEAKNAEFAFGDNGSKSVTAGGNTYVMPDVSATSTNTIGSKTVDGQTIYYPIVEIIMSDGKTSHSSGWNAYFPVLSGVVTITDYADAGTGAAVAYGASTQSMPAGLALVGDASTLFKYQSSSSAGSTPAVKNNILVYSSAKIEADRSEYNTVVEYTYTDNKGATYRYYVGYHAPAQTYSPSCVTGDTLVTLADGSMKRIDQVTYDDQLLAWNFFDGKYDVVPPAIIFSHTARENKVVKLSFDDESEIKIIMSHEFFDVDANEFVIVNSENVESYIGHKFLKADGNGFKTVELMDYDVWTEKCPAYGVVTALHYNALNDGFLTMTFAEEYLRLHTYFEVGENLIFDKAKMAEDTAKYGLYTYEDFADYLTPEFFDGYNVKYMKVAVGKGQYTYQGIIDAIQEWLVDSEEVLPADEGEDDTSWTPGYIPYDSGIEALTDEETQTADFVPETLTITASGNTVTAANYTVTVSNEGVTVTENGYVVDAYTADVIITAGGTASTGYAKITVDGEVYYTNQIASGESFTLTLKNAKGKEIAVESFWGSSANYGVAQDALIADGKVIEYNFSVAIEATNAEATEDGYTVTADEAVFTLTANGSATPGYAKIMVNGEDYYTVAFAKGETFSFTVKNANGKNVAIETFYGETTAENLLANGGSIGYVAEVTATNATLGEDGKYVVNTDDATITVTASGTSEGYAKVTVGDAVYYTEQIAAGESFTLTLKNAKNEVIAVEAVWGNSADADIAQDTLIESGKVIEYTFDVEITASGVEESELGYLCLTNEVSFSFTAIGTAKMGYVTITVDGDVYYTESIAPGETYNVTVKNAGGKAVQVAAYYGAPEGEIVEEYLIANNGAIDCGVFAVKAIDGTSVTLSNTTKYESDVCDIYVAVYDSTGRMTGIKAERNVSVGGKDEHTFDSELLIPEGGSAKVFIWNANTMIPIF